MSDASKSGDNRLFQLTVVLITAVIGPLVVFFVTNGAKSSQSAPAPAAVQTLPAASNQPTAGPTLIVVTATSPSGGQASPNPTAGPTVIVVTATSSTPTAVTNPKGTLPAGVIAQSGDLALWIEPDGLQMDGQMIGLQIHVRNTGSKPVKLTYKPGAITLQDERSSSYEPYYGDKKPECKKGDLGMNKNVQLNPQQEVVLASPALANYKQWCDAKSASAIPLFSGPLAQGAGVVRVGIQGVGPFNGFTIDIKRSAP